MGKGRFFFSQNWKHEHGDPFFFCASYIVREVLSVRERERRKWVRRKWVRRKWRHHCRAKIGDEFTLSLAKNSHNWRWVYTFPCQKFALFVSAFTLPVSPFTERSPLLLLLLLWYILRGLSSSKGLIGGLSSIVQDKKDNRKERKTNRKKKIKKKEKKKKLEWRPKEEKSKQTRRRKERCTSSELKVKDHCGAEVRNEFTLSIAKKFFALFVPSLSKMARAARRVIENPRQMIKSCPVLYCSSQRKNEPKTIGNRKRDCAWGGSG